MPKPGKAAASARAQGGGDEKDQDLVAFGKRLAGFRREAGLTQEGLAERAGLHWTYVGQVERGERNLSYRNVLKLADGLGIAAAKLMPPG